MKSLHGVSYAIIPDMIEAGTYMIAAAATHSVLTVANIIPKHLESITAKLEEMGVSVVEDDESVVVDGRCSLSRIRLKALPYPGFPTDMQPQMCVLLCLANGVSTITDSVWDNRFRYTGELARMGANITVEGKTATVVGGKLRAAAVKAVDLRAGAAMVIAGLAAEGRSTMFITSSAGMNVWSKSSMRSARISGASMSERARKKRSDGEAPEENGSFFHGKRAFSGFVRAMTAFTIDAVSPFDYALTGRTV